MRFERKILILSLGFLSNFLSPHIFATDCTKEFANFMTPKGAGKQNLFFSSDEFSRAQESLNKDLSILKNRHAPFSIMKRSGRDSVIQFKTFKSEKTFLGRVEKIEISLDESKIGETKFFIVDVNSKGEWVILEDVIPNSIQVSRIRNFGEPSWVQGLSPSKVAQKSGIHSLSHRTADLSLLKTILKEGQMKTMLDPTAIKMGGERGVYLSPLKTGVSPKWQPAPFPRQDIVAHIKPTIEFEVSLLDRDDFFLNRGWDYGVHSPYSFRASQFEELKRYLHFYGTANPIYDMPEIVFYGPVSLKNAKTIWVPSGTKAAFINELQAEEIQPPGAKPWEILIQEMDNY